MILPIYSPSTELSCEYFGKVKCFNMKKAPKIKPKKQLTQTRQNQLQTTLLFQTKKKIKSKTRHRW